jgi:hypothetical protein
MCWHTCMHDHLTCQCILSYAILSTDLIRYRYSRPTPVCSTNLANRSDDIRCVSHPLADVRPSGDTDWTTRAIAHRVLCRKAGSTVILGEISIFFLPISWCSQLNAQVERTYSTRVHSFKMVAKIYIYLLYSASEYNKGPSRCIRIWPKPGDLFWWSRDVGARRRPRVRHVPRSWLGDGVVRQWGRFEDRDVWGLTPRTKL